MDAELLAKYQQKFTVGFEQAQELFPACLEGAVQVLSPEGVEAYIDSASFVFKMGAGVEPGLIYLEHMPPIAAHLGEDALDMVAKYAYQIVRSPNKKSLIPFLESINAVCRRIDSTDELQAYLDILDEFVEFSQVKLHGNSVFPSAGMTPLLESMPQLISVLPLKGIRNFVDYGARNYVSVPDQQVEYFALKSQDARSIIHRERQGTIFKDVERHLYMLKDCMWGCDLPFMTFATAFDQLRKPVPYIDDEILAVPDVYEDENGVSGLDRYRATLAHLMGHKLWSGVLLADNYAPHMQLFMSTFEDCRIEHLAIKRFPGLKKLFLSLHPVPPKGACDPETQACLRYRATRLSRALMDETFDPENELIEDFRNQFNEIMKKGETSTTEEMGDLGKMFSC